MSDLSGAREMAMRMQSGSGERRRRGGRTRRRRSASAGRSARSRRRRRRWRCGEATRTTVPGGMAIAKRVAYEVGATGAAMFSSAGAAANEDEDGGSAGSIFVDVRMIQCLSRLIRARERRIRERFARHGRGRDVGPVREGVSRQRRRARRRRSSPPNGVPPENSRIRCGTSRFTWAAKN